MPSSATIASSDLTDFEPQTLARSSEVDGNFAIWRGHLLPVDPNTSAAIDAASATGYDIGSSQYRYRNIFIRDYFYLGSDVPNTAGSVRLFVDETSTNANILTIQRYSSTAYVTYSRIG